MARQTALPPSLAPRLLGRESAAAYLSISPSTLDELVRRGQVPRPKRLTDRRKAWDARQLDAFVDQLPEDEASGAPDTTWEDVDAA
jgi:predicted DNA-binding transcriptional regulator AlpA